jgi:hypothetical protein
MTAPKYQIPKWLSGPLPPVLSPSLTSQTTSDPNEHTITGKVDVLKHRGYHAHADDALEGAEEENPFVNAPKQQPSI